MSFEVPDIKNLAQVLEPVLKGAKFLGYEAKLLNAPGENYGSLMLAIGARVEENGVEKGVQMVAKLCPPNEWIKRMFATDRTFKKEVKFYLEIVPILLDFQISQNIPEERLINIFPECLGARLNLNGTQTVDEDAILILENLKVKNYNSSDRLVGLNLPESEIVLKNLARFHAVPLAYKLLRPTDFQNKIMPNLDKINIGQEMFDEVGHRFIESIARHLSLDEGTMDRFEVGLRKGFDFQKNFPSGNEMYATTVHRDFWVNNTMSYIENGLPVKNKLLDFQVITYGAPASDLVFFLYTSVMQDILESNLDHLIQVYHHSFIDSLKELNVDTTHYTLQSLRDEINIYGGLEMSHILIMFKAIYADREAIKELTDFGIEEMFSDDGLTDTYKKRLIWTVDHFLAKNWF